MTLPEYGVECVVRRTETVAVTFEIGDAVAFSYDDVSSKTEQNVRGTVAGYWGDAPVVYEDGWTRTVHGTHRRLFRLRIGADAVDTVRAGRIGDHPRDDEQLALKESYREPGDGPQADPHGQWRKRGVGLTAFEFDVELDDPDRPETRLSGVTLHLGGSE